MVTYFNKKDLVNFGNYLLSEEREQRIKERIAQCRQEGLNPVPYEDVWREVTHADIENFVAKK